MTTMLSVQDLVKDFGAHRAVDGVSFELEMGEVLGFLGPNGAGKSTTMKMITGYLVPTEGTVEVAGKNIKTHSLDVRRTLGYLPEGAPAWGDMTPYEFLKFIAEARGMAEDDIPKALMRVIEQTHIASVLHQSIETLSKGFRRRVGLAQALIHDPDVLILDEPTDGLDPNQKHEVRNLIRELASTKAIIISTHILEEVEAVCSRSIIIDRGRIVVDETPMSIKARSRYRGAVSFVVPTVEKNDESLRDKLIELKGVTSVEEDLRPRHVRYSLFLEEGTKPSTIETFLKRDKVTYEGFQIEAGRLDEVFRNLTHSDAPETGDGDDDEEMADA